MLDKFEEKINKIKKKSNPKVVAVVAFMIFGAVAIFSMEMANNFKRQKQQAENEYNKAMYQAVGYIKNVQTELAKLQITNTTKLTTTTLASIWKQANLAKENFESLPVQQDAMANAAKYLSQLSDYSYTLMKQTVTEERITDKEYEDIKTLYGECKELANVMNSIYVDLNNGRIKWDELKKQGNEKLPTVDTSTTVANIQNIGKTFQEYEGLIYDGAFSDHLMTTKPKSLSENPISVEEAKDNIIKIFGRDDIEYINAKEESSGRVELYHFDVKLKSSEFVRDVSMTKNDGKLYLMIGDRKVQQENITMNQAKKEGKAFLKKLGMDNLQDTYYLKTENMAIINYAAKQDDIILYPDLVKVKVALDTGEVCSVEAQGYIFNHITREQTKPKISLEKAKESLNKNIEVMSHDIAIIPTESKDEVLTYEFKGMVEESEFLIYINAETGLEEKVLMILETPGGILTM